MNVGPKRFVRCAREIMPAARARAHLGGPRKFEVENRENFGAAIASHEASLHTHGFGTQVLERRPESVRASLSGMMMMMQWAVVVVAHAPGTCSLCSVLSVGCFVLEEALQHAGRKADKQRDPLIQSFGCTVKCVSGGKETRASSFPSPAFRIFLYGGALHCAKKNFR